jgi:ABC-type polysaccharide/polyol phosphate export permease
VLFPAEVLPLVSVLTNMVHFFLGLPILVAFLVIYHQYPLPENLLWFPVAVAIQLLFTSALALILAALAVHFRDIKDILSNLLTLWFFATPIIYPITQAPERVRRFLYLNPFTHLAVAYQEVLFTPGPFRNGVRLLAVGAASVLVFLFGYFVFDRLRDTLAEEV